MLIIKNIHYLSVILISFVLSTESEAHNGRKDSQGGHYDSRTGVYHCHQTPCVKKPNRSPSREIKSTNQLKEMPRISLANSEYKRSEWPHWVDLDGDCQDSRAEALIKLSSTPVKFKRNKGCDVSHGTFYGVYSNKVFTAASKLDIDHIVPLEDAHETGGYAWDKSTRRAFANDPDNLIPVDLSLNRSKGAKNPLEWMPPFKDYHCSYLTQWIDIKQKYQLHVRSGVKRLKRKACDKTK